jgi:Uma2 family endonuclease
MKTISTDRTKEWTAEDYLLLGETNSSCQLINGELIMSPSPHPNHQRVLGKLFKIFDFYKQSGEAFFAPIDLFIDNRNVFQPDLVLILDHHKKSITHRGIEGPVDIVVEIISPSSSYTDRNQKKNRYLAFGLSVCWIVDPGTKSIETYTPSGGTDAPVAFISTEGEIKSTVVPERNVNLNDIF